MIQKAKKIYLVLFLFISINSCGIIATTFTQKKKSVDINASNINEANNYFWNNFHKGNYDSVNNVIDKLNIALQQNANSLPTITHLGFAHIWALAERQNLQIPNATITEHILLSHKYFVEANSMNPHDLRVLGFLADLTLAEGTTLNNKKEITKGYFLGLKSIRKWPQFNKFTVGYFFSALNKTDKNFKQGLKWQYTTINDCACQKNTEKNLADAVLKIKTNKDPKIARACWNSWIAPHNWEGFCLNWGDMLTKNGEHEEAKKIYALAQLSDTYKIWPYKNVLEKRINEVAKNEIDFNKPINEVNLNQQNVIMFNSKIACMACHQAHSNEFVDANTIALPKNIYNGKH